MHKGFHKMLPSGYKKRNYDLVNKTPVFDVVTKKDFDDL